MPRLVLLLVVAVCPLLASRAEALTLLTRGKTAVVRDRAGDARDSALIGIGGDPALAAPVDPRCPTTTSVELATYPVAQNRVVSAGRVALPCERWKAAGRGYRYSDPTGSAGGVRTVVYAPGKLLLEVRGAGTPDVGGPVGYLEAWLGVGTERYLVRVHNFRRNDAGLLVARRPSSAAAAGEAAFWDVLWGDDDSEAHQQAALSALEKADKRSRKDGRSRFLLGMMHLYRFGRSTPDYRTASEAAQAELMAAHDAFQAAVPLLWDGARGDSRVPGFAAATRYVVGVVSGDGGVEAQGLAELDTAVQVNPIFNLFDLLGVVPQAITGQDPLYGRVVDALDFALSPENASCVTTQPEVCGNDGMAPHNIEGAFLLFGDLYAKGGVVDSPNPFRGARNLYGATVAFGNLFGWNPAFQAQAAARAADPAARAALYQDGDAGNDPLIIGSAPGEACATCHHKR